MGWQSFKIILCCVVLFVSSESFAVSKAESNDGPEIQVRLFVSAIQTVAIPKTLLEQKERIRSVLSDRFDYQKFAERALWDQKEILTPNDMKDFLDLFPKCFEKRILSKLNTLEELPPKFQIHLVRAEGDIAQVQAQATSKKRNIKLDLFLINRNGTWKIFDLSINSANLTRNYQSQFNKIIREYGFVDLLERMRKEV